DGRLTFDPGSRVVPLPYINYLQRTGHHLSRCLHQFPHMLPFKSSYVEWSICPPYPVLEQQ
ncbi:hypothetical protein CRUP_034676, partial [Coryphaenoides rupestris]